jgi:TPR repeat protein
MIGSKCPLAVLLAFVFAVAAAVTVFVVLVGRKKRQKWSSVVLVVAIGAVLVLLLALGLYYGLQQCRFAVPLDPARSQFGRTITGARESSRLHGGKHRLQEEEVGEEMEHQNEIQQHGATGSSSTGNDSVHPTETETGEAVEPAQEEDNKRDSLGPGHTVLIVPKDDEIMSTVLHRHEPASADSTMTADQKRKLAKEEYNLGWASRNKGILVQENCNAAIKHFTRAAELGSSDAEYTLGNMYDHGTCVSIDKSVARMWYARAANQNHGEAQNNLGLLYEHGRGGSTDIAGAVELYKKAIENNSVVAHLNMGLYYQSKQDHEKAVQHFEIAANGGNAKAMYQLAHCFYHNHGVENDFGQALYWYTRAAEQKHVKSQNNLALMYERGDGVNANMDTAMYWYNQAADNGSAVADYNLGLEYTKRRDFKEAKKHFERALERAAGLNQDQVLNARSGLNKAEQQLSLPATPALDGTEH